MPKVLRQAERKLQRYERGKLEREYQEMHLHLRKVEKMMGIGRVKNKKQRKEHRLVSEQRVEEQRVREAEEERDSEYQPDSESEVEMLPKRTTRASSQRS